MTTYFIIGYIFLYSISFIYTMFIVLQATPKLITLKEIVPIIGFSFILSLFLVGVCVLVEDLLDNTKIRNPF